MTVGHYRGAGVDGRGWARRERKAMSRLTVRGRRNAARRECDWEAVIPTSQGRTAPPKPPAPKKRAPSQVESSRKIWASQVTKIGY